MKLWLSVVALSLLLAASSAFAQRGGAAGGPGNRGGGAAALMEFTPQGLFVIRNGAIAKFDAATLKPAGALIELLGPAPQAPANFQDRAAVQAYFTAMQQRNQAPAMLMVDKDMLLLFGDQFFRIDTEKMIVKTKSSIAPPVDPAAPATVPVNTAGTPVLTLKDNTLFVLRGMQLVSVNIEDGKVLASSVLPAQMEPPANGGFGRQPGAAGGNGGAAGGNGGPAGGRGGRGGANGGAAGGRGGRGGANGNGGAAPAAPAPVAG